MKREARFLGVAVLVLFAFAGVKNLHQQLVTPVHAQQRDPLMDGMCANPGDCNTEQQMADMWGHGSGNTPMQSCDETKNTAMDKASDELMACYEAQNEWMAYAGSFVGWYGWEDTCRGTYNNRLQQIQGVNNACRAAATKK